MEAGTCLNRLNFTLMNTLMNITHTRNSTQYSTVPMEKSGKVFSNFSRFTALKDLSARAHTVREVNK